jgi:hypothetical protein
MIHHLTGQWSAWTLAGELNVMRTARSLQRSCRAISAVLVNRPAISPSSQRRAFASASSSRPAS